MATLAEMGEVDEIVHSNEESIKTVGSVNGDDCSYQENEVLSDTDDVESVAVPIDISDDPLVSPPPPEDVDENPIVINHIDEEKTESNDTNVVRDDGDELEQSDDVIHLPNGVLDENNSIDDSNDSSSTTKDVVETLSIHETPENEDILVIDDKDPIENGSISSMASNRSTPSVEEQTKTKQLSNTLTKRKKGKSYTNGEESESDIEEVMPEDPLADFPTAVAAKRQRSRPIVVKDTKSLADIASISTGSKSEPTLVIIDTNSILSGRGPVPVSHKPPQPVVSNTFPLLPVALPAQGHYPANMRATITPIPPSVPKSTSSIKPNAVLPPQVSSPPVLPTLTDDMYVVEAPSFIVPYVYEKPPVKDLKEVVTSLKEVKPTPSDNTVENKDELKKPPATYFESPLGKFFIGIGSSLVQEHVQTDLLKQQKRKRDRESGSNAETLKTISSLIKNLEFTKENNEPFYMETKKCEYCSFRTESALAMAFHLETPHMKNFIYKCNFCSFEVRSPHDILYHMEIQHGVRGRLERAPGFHQCPNCPFEDNQKGKLSRHLVTCARKYKPERNLEPPVDYEPPAKIPRANKMKQPGIGSAAAVYQAMTRSPQFQMLAAKAPTPTPTNMNAVNRNRGRPSQANVAPIKQLGNIRSSPGMLIKSNMSGGSVLLPSNYQISGNQVYQPNQTTPNIVSKGKPSQPSISITPLPRNAAPPAPATAKPGDSTAKNSFVICEICDGYIKDLEQLRNHMQWIHKVKIHPKMIYNRPPLNCQKCQFRFFTDQGLERHLLGSHGLVTSSMQEAANKSKDAGRCPVCGRVYQWKLLNHVARDHNMTLKPAHLSYKCTVCTATFGMYRQFESHVYSAHSVVAKRAMDKKNTSATTSVLKNDLKPLKINDEITIIPQPAKGVDEASNSLRQSNGNSEIHDVDDDSTTPEKRKAGDN